MISPPPLVERARRLAGAAAFTRSSSPETGRLLHVLAAAVRPRRAGEIGTGHGVGAAWIVAALEPATPFVTVEADARRAESAALLFRDDPNVTVLHGDWHDLMPAAAPFDLLFYDGGGKQRPHLDGEQVLGLLAPRGTLVMDDLTPGRPAAGDPVRSFWLRHPELAAVEVPVSQREAVIVAARIR